MDAIAVLDQLTAPQTRANPFPLYEQARELGPVLPVTDTLVLVTGYAAADRVLRDREFGVLDREASAAVLGDEPRPRSWELFGRSILMNNPPLFPVGTSDLRKRRDLDEHEPSRPVSARHYPDRHAAVHPWVHGRAHPENTAGVRRRIRRRTPAQRAAGLAEHGHPPATNPPEGGRPDAPRPMAETRPSY
ncbi:hypothetical protein [Embleya scabrispora]|uniref:hypothetical protein n=1 Tax=Embleya scabrispora TaxID=159449 RepID=UPI00036240B2|nr:hypothetical protein [Embleya scabrispora]MYS82681.1 hypothetical protein [Streptomyces sp. SID5474]